MTDEWLDSNACAALLKISRGHFMERVATRRGFPAPSERFGRPRWLASEVHAWMKGHEFTRAA